MGQYDEWGHCDKCKGLARKVKGTDTWSHVDQICRQAFRAEFVMGSYFPPSNERAIGDEDRNG